MTSFSLKFIILFSVCFSTFAQFDVNGSLGKKSVTSLPIGTVMTLDGKKLNNIQSKCPNKIKTKMLIKGEEVEVSSSNLLFQDGNVSCNGGVDFSLIITDLSGRYVSLKGKVANKNPLQCKVKEVTEVEGSIAIYLDAPCSVSLFFKRTAFDLRDVTDLTLDSFKYNLGDSIDFSLDHEHKAPLSVNSDLKIKNKSDKSPPDKAGSKDVNAIRD